MDENIIWKEPKKPRKIEEEKPHGSEIFTKKARIGKDGHDQLLVRFPTEVAEEAKIEEGQTIIFTVKTKVPPTNNVRDIEIKIELDRRTIPAKIQKKKAVTTSKKKHKTGGRRAKKV